MDEDTLNREFGAKLRTLRTHASLTQDELAGAANISRTSIVNIERGRQGVSLSTLYRLAHALARPPGELLPVPPDQDTPHIAIGDDSEQSVHALHAVLRRAQAESDQP